MHPKIDIPQTPLKGTKKTRPKGTPPPKIEQTQTQDQQQPLTPPPILNLDEGKSLQQIQETNRIKLRPWEQFTNDFFKQNDKELFVERFLKLNIPNNWIASFLKALELSAKDGVAFNQFIAQWGLLSGDVTRAAQKYPSLHRGIQITRELRKKPLMDATIAKAHQSPHAALTAIKSDEFMGDALLEHDIKESAKTVEDKAEELLLAKGVEPCEYAQVQVLQGDLPSINHFKTKDYDQIGLSPEQVINLLGEKDGVGFSNSETAVGLPSAPAPSKGWDFQIPIQK